MFDNHVTKNNSSTVINTPATGIIQRSNKKSFFLRFHENSEMASKWLFKKDPKHHVKNSNNQYIYDEHPVSILQIMLTNDGYVIAEVIYCDDEAEIIN